MKCYDSYELCTSHSPIQTLAKCNVLLGIFRGMAFILQKTDLVLTQLSDYDCSRFVGETINK